MKVAITAQGSTLDDPFDSRFGRAPYFLVGESQGGAFIAIENSAAQTAGGAGIAAAQLMADQGVEAVVTGQVGPNAAQVLQAAGIKVYCTTATTAREALQALGNEQIATVTEEAVAPHTGKQAVRSGEPEPVEQNCTLAIATGAGDTVSPHFGHCPEYTFVTVKKGAVVSRRIVPNPGHQPDFLPQYLADKGVNIVIAGGMGPRAVGLFQARGIKTILGVTGKVNEVVEAFRSGRLQSGESTCAHG